MKVYTYDDITGTGVAAQLITLLKIGGVAQSQQNWDSKWWQITAVAAAGQSRVGSSAVSATNGIPIGVSANGQFIPPIAFATDKYELSDAWVLLASGDTYSVARGV